MHGLLIAASLLGPPAAAVAATQAQEVTAGPRPIARVWLRGEGIDTQALAAAVQARLGDKEILGPGAAAGPGQGLAALCLVRWDARAGLVRLEVILGDGRVYERSIAAKATGRERTAARLLASTLASIEDETATPDRHDGVFDAPEVLPGGEDATGVDAPAAAPEPEDVTTVPAPPFSPPVEVRAQDELAAGPVARPSTTRTGVQPGPLELGVAVDSGAVFGLGLPAGGGGLAGAGGGLRVELRLRRGVLLGAGFRGIVNARDALVLGRFRGALVAGYVYRRGALELAALGGPTLETWQVTQRGAPVAYAASGPGGASLLLGALARLVVGGRLTRGRRAALRVGGYLEFAGSARTSGRATQVARLADMGAPVTVFVLGGAELSAGIELELWVALRRVRARGCRSCRGNPGR